MNVSLEFSKVWLGQNLDISEILNLIILENIFDMGGQSYFIYRVSQKKGGLANAAVFALLRNWCWIKNLYNLFILK